MMKAIGKVPARRSRRLIAGAALAALCAIAPTAGAVEVLDEGDVNAPYSAPIAVTLTGAAVMFAAGSFLGRNVDVHLATGGKLTLADNARIVCRNLYFDGVKQRIGTYGNSTSAADNRNDTYFMMSSNNDLKGVLDVQGDGRGTVVFFR